MTDPSEIPTITSQIRNKIDNTTLILLQSLTSAPRQVMSQHLDTTNLSSITILIHLGRTTTNAFTSGINFRIEQSAAPVGGNGFWFPITIFTSSLGTNVGSQAVNGAALAGQKVIPIAATANFVVGDIVYIKNTTISNSEFGRITVVTLNTSITIEDNLRFDQTTSTVTSKAEVFYGLFDMSSCRSLRIVVDGSGTGQNFDVEVFQVVGA